MENIPRFEEPTSPQEKLTPKQVQQGDFFKRLPASLRTAEMAEQLIAWADGSSGINEEVSRINQGDLTGYERNSQLDSLRSEDNVAGQSFETYVRDDGQRVVSFYLKEEKEDEEPKRSSFNVFDRYATPDVSERIVLQHFLDKEGKVTCFNVVRFHGKDVDKGLVYVSGNGNTSVNYYDGNIGEITRDDAKPIYEMLGGKQK